MSNKRTTKSALKKAKAKAEPTFSIERFRRGCYEYFGVTVSTFDGATHGLEGDFTFQQMNKIIEAWLNQPAMPAKKEAE